MEKNNIIYTIGYSCFSIQDFIHTLKQYGINSLIDVRSSPYSQYHTDYNREALDQTLKRHHIFYKNYQKEFGARQENSAYHPNGYLSFPLFTQSKAFQEGMNRIIKAMTLPENYRFVLMCAEKDALTCHRNIMVARAFYQNGIPVRNIRADGSFETQEQLEERLVDMYYPNRDQLSFFDAPLSWEEMVKNSYQFQNEKIGYRLDASDEEEFYE